MKNQLLKEYIQKQVKSLLKEEVYGNKAIVYHRTKLNIEQLNDIFFNKKWSFGSNAGSMYGNGLYTTYSLESQMKENMIYTYGKNIIKFSVNLKNFLICDYKEFQKTPQYQRLNKPKEKDENGNLVYLIEQLKDKNLIIKDLYNKNEDYTSDTILYLLNKFPKIKILFDGIMYTGRHDGKCCLIYSNSVYNTSIPLGYYTPKNGSFQYVNNYEYISSFNNNTNFKNVVNNKLNKNINNKNIDVIDYLNLILTGEMTLKDVPEKLIDYSLCKKVVSNDGATLGYVPKHLIDYSLCEIAVSNYGGALEYVPKHLIDYSLCEIAVTFFSWNLYYVPEKFKTKELCEIAVSSDGRVLQYVPKDIENYYSLCEIAVSNNGKSLEYVPEELRDYSLYEIAVLQNKEALKYIPEDLLFYPICKKAVFKNGLALEYVKEKFKTKELCEKAVKDDGRALQFVPKDIENYYSLCEKAVLQNKEALIYITKDIENYYSLCEKAASKDKEAIYYIKDPIIKQQIMEKYGLLKEYISKQVKTLLKESVTDEVYHFTFLSNIINILQTNQFQLGLNNDPDDTNTDETNLKHKYYMSVSRTKSPKVGFLSFDSDDVREASMEYYDLDFMVRLKLNGRLLSQNYKSVPFNYTKHVYIKDKSHEYEDRILSNKPTIENFSKYIIQIDIKQVNNNYAEEEGEEALNEIINQLQNLCKQRNIKLNIVNPNKIDKNYLEEYIQKQVRKILKESLNK